jgi:hypothetical protein
MSMTAGTEAEDDRADDQQLSRPARTAGHRHSALRPRPTSEGRVDQVHPWSKSCPISTTDRHRAEHPSTVSRTMKPKPASTPVSTRHS